MTARHAVKRMLDVVGSMAIMLVMSPLFVACSIAVAATSPGPVIFAQLREGRGRRPFMMYKFRTMRLDGGPLLAAWLSANDSTRQEWETFGRLKADPRVIPLIGQVLRRTSLDELPQLWNVLSGEMSLVGPRPLELHLAKRFSDSARNDRAVVRPGITGLWQISGRGDLNLDAMIEIDLDYLRGWSLLRDVAILARTPGAVVGRRGAY